MKQGSVTIVDYGLGNLFSISRAIEHLGLTAIITEDPKAVDDAQRLILPGVGAFGHGISNLERRGLTGAIKNFAMVGRPILGICLGMQLLMDESEELGAHKGLGILSGNVARISVRQAVQSYKIPHVGWNAISRAAGINGWENTILKGIPDGSFMYFVHSYASSLLGSADTIAVTSYGGYDFPSVVQKGAVCGCQFHPEKSGPAGLMILKNFMALSN